MSPSLQRYDVYYVHVDLLLWSTCMYIIYGTIPNLTSRLRLVSYVCNDYYIIRRVHYYRETIYNVRHKRIIIFFIRTQNKLNIYPLSICSPSKLKPNSKQIKTNSNSNRVRSNILLVQTRRQTLRQLLCLIAVTHNQCVQKSRATNLEFSLSGTFTDFHEFRILATGLL